MSLAPEVAARRRAFAGAFLGWMLDGYDFALLTFVLIDIEREFGISHAATGGLGTATLLMRLAGGTMAGMAADRWGRKGPLMVSIAWFSIFAFLSALSPTYRVLLIFRALFGLGMGGEWAAGMPLVLEHFPEQRRSAVLGVLQGAYSWGFMLAAAAFQFLMPALRQSGISPWRALMFTGVLPALLVLWIRRGVSESPIWLARRRSAATGTGPASRRLRVWPVLRAAGILSALMFAYQSMTFWYASLLRERDLAPLVFQIALNLGGIAGAAAWGRLAGTRLGHRGAIVIGTALSLLSLPAFLLAQSPLTLWLGALAIGCTGAGIIGVTPSFVGNQFDVSSRGTGWGIVYHLAVAVAAAAPLLIGELQDYGWSLRIAMASSIGAASLITLVLVSLTSGAHDQKTAAAD